MFSRNFFGRTRRGLLAAGSCLVFAALPGFVSAGPLQRVPNTTLAMPPAPPTFGFTSTNAFPGIVFTNPVAITAPPGETNRLFVVGKNGDITVISNLLAPTRSTFMDLTPKVSHQDANSGIPGEKGMLGLAFHPGYATNGYFYVFYMSTNSAIGGFFDNLSRFSVSTTNANRADTNSEVLLFSQYDRDDNHNGGDIHFGADGYLYISVGDEGKEYDGRNVAQVITNHLFSGFLRIDVDKRPGNLTPNASPSTLTITTNYSIPADNPYIGATSFNGFGINSNQVRTEFWAVGLRNPWRWSFDYFTNSAGTNVIYCGDVGQDHFEEVDVIQRAGNYGWAYYEGTNVASGGSTGLPHTPYITNQAANLYFPIVHYADTNPAASQGNCVIGGVVYRGQRLSQLNGCYVYGDYVTGNIWTLVASNYTKSPTNIGGASGPTPPIITDSSARVTCFGTDPASGDVFYAATKTTGFATAATIQRIVYNNTTNGAPLPPTLANTGAFTNLLSLTSAQDPLQPAAGIVPFDINVPFWSDNAIKSRWFSVPNTNLTIGFNPAANWTFPTGTVWIKHFNLQLTNGDPASEIRLETRLLVKNASGVYGVVYRWGNSQTNATLVSSAGLDEAFVVNDGGSLRTQVWHYPSQLECQICHTPEGGFGLGFRTEQLNKDFAYAAGTTNEILALSDAGYFSSPVTNDVTTLLALAAATNTSASLEFRSRSFLAANCSQCHQPGGSVQSAQWDARITTPTALAGLINATPINNLGDPSNHIVTPLLTNNSVLLTRIATRGAGSVQMPPLDSNLVDTQAVDVVSQWILSLSNQFWVGVSPETQSIPAGNNAPYTVAYVATDDFTNDVALSVSGLPAGAGGGFVPATVNNSVTNSTLTITTTGATPNGTYLLTVTGIGGGQTNTDTFTLTIAPATTAPGTLLWTSGSGANTNWSTSGNWTNLTAGGFGPPGPQNNVLFNNTAVVGSPGTINNVVDTNTTIGSLQYANNATVANYQVTQIAVGQSLTATNGLVVGTGTDAGAGALVNAVITGTGGRLAVSNGLFAVTQGSGSDGAHQAVLDMSGLGTLNINVGRISIAVLGSPAQTGNGGQRSAGTVYLAKTNFIAVSTTGVTNGILVGWNDSQGNGTANRNSALYLGQTNAVFTDAVYVGTDKTSGALLAFNPSGLVNPSAYFRGIGGASSRVSLWGIGDTSMKNNSNQNSSATNDFTGGTIDALVGVMNVGVTTTGTGGSATTGNGAGTLTFNSGTIDVNTLTNGCSAGTGTAAGSDIGNGVVNVNGTATLKVNNLLALAFNTSTGTGIPSGAVNLRGGTGMFNSVIAGTGTSAITASNATLILTNRIGSPTAPVGTVALTNSLVRLRLNGSAVTTNITAATLSAGGVNTIQIDSLINVSTTTTFPLFAYTALNGSVAANFAVGALPPNFAASLADNPARKTVDLVVTHAPVTPTIGTALLSETNLLVTGTNGAPNWTFYLLTSTNIGDPVTNWSASATGLFDVNGAFRLTNSADPAQPQRFYLLQLP